ncbi:hypothetical protein [Duganella rhizosphaerae]|uniref:hypothetical protein n=1 Tax=Duganella rhizosphaerae TaxID=2885763 RepID=UPI00403FB2FE
MKRFLLMLCLALAGCGGPQVVVVQGEGAQQAIEKKSLAMVFSGKTSTGWTKHQRGTGLQQPMITDEEKLATSARCKQFGNGIVKNLPLMSRTPLAPYLASSDKDYRNALTVEINRIIADTDGSADIVVTVSYGARGNDKQGWSRIIHIQASPFSSAESVSRELADSMLAQLKASALIQ